MDLPESWNAFSTEHLSHRLLLLAKMIDRDTARMLGEEFGISLAEWRVMAFIGISGPCTASMIGRAAEIDRAEISRAVGKLEDAKFVSREADKNHKRRFILNLTAHGTGMFETIREKRREYLQAILEDIGVEQQELLGTVLDQIVRNVLIQRERRAE
ncbi:MarR family winged helix-turn-helix transcriptional regulator [Altererythrobacter sp.]|uniref:MarR family winged helix-turn-helix transcriptional regulator n=1 Tax=Altererythrobacter sp. TaxID=1872480 RepID=UPI003D02CC50